MTPAERARLIEMGYNPDDYISESDLQAQQPAAKQTPTKNVVAKPSAAASFTGSLARGIPSAAAAGGTAALTTAALTALNVANPLIGFPVTLATAGLAGYGTRRLQESIAPSIIPNYAETQQAQQEAHPYASMAGEITSNIAGGLNPNILNIPRAGRAVRDFLSAKGTVLKSEEIQNLSNVGLGAVIPPVQETAISLARGEGIPDISDLLISSATGAVFNKPNWLGHKVFRFPDVAPENPVFNRREAEIAQREGEPMETQYPGYLEPETPITYEDYAAMAAQTGQVPDPNRTTPASASEIRASGVPGMEAVDPVKFELKKQEAELKLRKRIAKAQAKAEREAKAAGKKYVAEEVEQTNLENVVAGLKQQRAREFLGPEAAPEAVLKFAAENYPEITTEVLKKSLGQKSPLNQPATSQKLADQLKAAGVARRATQSWHDIFVKLGVARGTRVEKDGTIINEKTGKPIPGVSYVEQGVKESASKINPDIAGLDTWPHEIFHVMFRFLQNGKDKFGQRIIKQGLLKTEQSPEYLNAKDAYFKKNGYELTPEEFLVNNVGKGVVRHTFNLNKESPITSWMSDFWAHIKARFNKATPEDYHRLLTNKLLYDAPRTDVVSRAQNVAQPEFRKDVPPRQTVFQQPESDLSEGSDPRGAWFPGSLKHVDLFDLYQYLTLPRERGGRGLSSLEATEIVDELKRKKTPPKPGLMQQDESEISPEPLTPEQIAQQQEDRRRIEEFDKQVAARGRQTSTRLEGAGEAEPKKVRVPAEMMQWDRNSSSLGRLNRAYSTLSNQEIAEETGRTSSYRAQTSGSHSVRTPETEATERYNDIVRDFRTTHGREPVGAELPDYNALLEEEREVDTTRRAQISEREARANALEQLPAHLSRANVRNIINLIRDGISEEEIRRRGNPQAEINAAIRIDAIGRTEQRPEVSSNLMNDPEFEENMRSQLTPEERRQHNLPTAEEQNVIHTYEQLADSLWSNRSTPEELLELGYTQEEINHAQNIAERRGTYHPELEQGPFSQELRQTASEYRAAREARLRAQADAVQRRVDELSSGTPRPNRVSQSTEEIRTREREQARLIEESDQRIADQLGISLWELRRNRQQQFNEERNRAARERTRSQEEIDEEQRLAEERGEVEDRGETDMPGEDDIHYQPESEISPEQVERYSKVRKSYIRDLKDAQRVLAEQADITEKIIRQYGENSTQGKAAIKEEYLLSRKVNDLANQVLPQHAVAKDSFPEIFHPEVLNQPSSEITPEDKLPAYKGKQSFHPIATSRYDKIAEKFKTPLAQYVTDQLHKFSGESDYLQGQIGNRLIAIAKGLPEEGIQKVYKYLYDVDDTGKSNLILSAAEKTVATNVTKLLRDLRKKQISMGIQVQVGKGKYRIAGIKPEGYIFNVIDPKIPYTWAESGGSPEALAYDKAYIDHQVKHGMSKEEATKALEEYKIAMGNNVARQAEFNALRKAEGNGLPWLLVDKNFNSAATRYGRRAAKDLAYFQHIQNNPRMRSALGLRDQFDRPPEHTDAMASSEEVQGALRSVFGLDVPRSAKMMTAARLVANLVMGPGTAIRNIANMGSFIAQYVPTGQMGLVGKAFANMNTAKVRAFESNAVRSSFHDYDAAGFFEGHPNPAVRLLNRFSYMLRRYQGRELSDKFEGAFYYSLGEQLATTNIANAKLGDKAALKFVKRFSDINEGDVLKKKITPDDISRIAKRFVDAARGTYGAEGLPAFALEGEFAPFVALSRFSIEKSNTIYKDVVKPMQEGDFGPLIRYTLASLGVGAIISDLNEKLTNKRGQDPTIAELKATPNLKPEDAVAKTISLLQMASFAGSVSDAAKAAMQLYKGKTARYSNPLSFPLYTLATDTIGANVGDALAAMREGEDPFEVMANLATAISTQSMQSMRYLDANFWHPEEAKRKERFRDYRVFQELSGKAQQEEPSEHTDVLGDASRKKFKRTSDLKEAVQALPDLIHKAFDKAAKNGALDVETLRSELRKIKSNSYQVFPSIETMPLSFFQYLKYLEKSQGEEVAKEKLTDYIKQNTVNQIKSELVPSI